MKFRKGYVSNSSSSSFVICKEYMTDEQIKEFKEFISNVSEFNEEGYEKEYYISEDDFYFSGYGEQSDGEEYEQKLSEMNLDKKTHYGYS